MARSFPVPLYTTNTLFDANTNQRTLSGTNPNTESTATQVATGLVGSAAGTVLAPQNSAGTAGGAGDRDVPAAGKIRGHGWGIEIVPLIEGVLGTVSIEKVSVIAGTWSVPIHFSRPGGLGTGDIVVDPFTVILHKIDFVPNPSRAVLEDSLQEIGRAASGSVTVTTTEQSTTVDVSGGAVEFLPGDFLWVEVYASRSNPVLNDILRVHTQSATALRASAAPTYAVGYGRDLSDSAPTTDSLDRLAVYARDLSDATTITDELDHQETYARTLTDAIDPVTDGIERQVDYNRDLSENIPVTDEITRQITTFRDLLDDAPTVDSLDRTISVLRDLSDSIDPVTDALEREAIFTRNPSDAIDPIADSIERLMQYQRELSDLAPTVDSLSRTVTYARKLEDDLTSGGGVTIRPIILLVDD